MGFEIGFMGNLYYTAPFCYFHIQTAHFFYLIQGKMFRFRLVCFTHGMFIRRLTVVFRFDQYLILPAEF
jgi:hypothetical protein